MRPSDPCRSHESGGLIGFDGKDGARSLERDEGPGGSRERHDAITRRDDITTHPPAGRRTGPARRAVLVGMMLVAARVEAAPASAWEAWRQRFLQADGRVVDEGGGPDGRSTSHSEGQGWGLLLAQAHGDRAAFEAIETWTRRHLLIREDALMAWRGGDGRPTDWRSATDGDLFRAWALLRAARDSGWGGARRAHAVAQAIAALCLAPDPRAADEPVLIPGAEWRPEGGRVPFNPSYVMPRALRELGMHAGLPSLVRAADHGETLLSELAGRPLPDWVAIGAAGPAPLPGKALVSGYDALRVPLYLSWSGIPDHPAAIRGRRDLLDGAWPGHAVVGRSADGQPTAQSNHAGFRSVARLAGGGRVAPDGPTIAAQPYYPATLHMLAAVASRES